MKRTLPAVLAGVFTIVALLCGACTFEDSLGEVACEDDADCADDYFCALEGYCVRRDPAQPVEPMPCDGACVGDEVCDEASDTCVCPAADGAAARACVAGELCCAGEGCVEVTADPEHCGACGVTCGGGEVCSGGACVCGEVRAESGGAACAAPAVCCDGRCADPRFDPQCCGTLEVHTDCGGLLCQSGECICAAGTATCEGDAPCATNLLEDPEHCGDCTGENASCGDLACVGGTCSCGGTACATGSSCCVVGNSRTCIDLTSNAQHCGGCGMACRPGERCEGRACRCGINAACAAGELCCGGTCVTDPNDSLCVCGDGACDLTTPDCCGETCVDLSQDVENCGECGRSCGEGQACFSGTCVCSDPLRALCGEGCVDLLADVANCGTCGTACAEGAACCGGQCKDLASDLQNCGACGSFCGGESCAEGQCSCGGTPVNLDIDPNNCGQCARSCSRPHVSAPGCIAGVCRYENAMCEAGWGDCNGDKALDGCETELAAANAHCGACDNACAAPAFCAAGQCVTVDKAVEVVTGRDFTCARRTSGAVLCWGDGSQGQIGNASTSDRHIPTQVPGVLAIDLDAGVAHVCAVTPAGEVWCWGKNDYGEVGLAATGVTSTPTQVTLPGPASEVAAGNDHSCAIVDRSATGGAVGEVWCWGRGKEGRLGDGDDAEHRTEVGVRAGSLTEVVDVATTSERHTCAVRANGTAWCWGEDDDGRLADDDWFWNVNVTSPEQIDLGTPPTFVAIDVGWKTTVALTNTGEVWGWGANASEMLLGAGGIDPALIATAGARIAVGEETVCGIGTDTLTYCWGKNHEGQVGDGTTTSPRGITLVSGLAAGSVVDLDVHRDHACAVLTSGGIKCWGHNNDGKLGRGMGNTTDSEVPVDVVGLP